ncbi:MAG: hypothetical protein LT070_06585 [Solirubrobacteraceae bacterium]|nr:hypothetical protein [Solirubrobacteraceae bacterium]
MPSESLTLIAAEELLQLMLSHATDGDAPITDYKRCRGTLLKDPAASGHVPRFVGTCHDPNAFWHFIKSKYSGTGSYAARRKYLYEEFRPLLDHLERLDMSPHDASVDVQVGNVNAASVTTAWSKAVARD